MSAMMIPLSIWTTGVRSAHKGELKSMNSSSGKCIFCRCPKTWPGSYGAQIYLQQMSERSCRYQGQYFQSLRPTFRPQYSLPPLAIYSCLENLGALSWTAVKCSSQSYRKGVHESSIRRTCS